MFFQVCAMFSLDPGFPAEAGLGCFPDCAIYQETAFILVNSACSEMFMGIQTNWHRMFCFSANNVSLQKRAAALPASCFS